MRKFFFKLSIYFSVLFALCAIIIYIAGSIIENKVSFKIAGSTLVLGDSYTQYSVNDSLMDNTTNLSQSADLYIYSYAKLRKLVAENPGHIKTLVLSCSNKNIDGNISDMRLLKKEQLVWKIESYFFLFNAEDISNLLAKTPKWTIYSYLSFLKGKAYTAITMPRQADMKSKTINFGGYTPLTHIKTAKQDSVRFERVPPFYYSHIQLQYLEKIAAFCKAHNIELVLVRPPIHYYYNRKNEKEYLGVVKGKFSNLRFLDYADYKFPDSCYADLTHLNNRGTPTFTRMLNNDLKAARN